MKKHTPAQVSYAAYLFMKEQQKRLAIHHVHHLAWILSCCINRYVGHAGFLCERGEKLKRRVSGGEFQGNICFVSKKIPNDAHRSGNVSRHFVGMDR